MEEIQKDAINKYTNNLEFFKKTDKDLYNRIISFSNLIDGNQYKERYHLEYIEEDQQFDIFDFNTKSYIYNRKPNQFIEEAVKNTNLDKLNSMDLLHPDIYNTRQPYTVNKEDNILTRTTMQYHNDIFDFIKIFKKSTVYKQKRFSYIEKFIFIGSLLGTHIEPIIKKLNLNFYLIYENNLEIFRLSLFTTDYSKLAKDARIIFSIMNDKRTTEWLLSQFYNHAIRSNYMIKYYCTNYNIHDYFDRILSVSSQRSPFAYSYTKMYEGFLEPNFKNIVKYPILNTMQHYDLFKNKPVLIIAAGPSFGNNLEWLKTNHTKYFIVAIGAVVKKLCDENIFPDMITNADGDEIIKNQFPDKIKQKLAQIPFLASTATADIVLNTFDTENIFLCEVMGAFKQNSKTINGYSVGEVTLSMIATLGANEIYLLGTDLALDQETGATHISGHKHSVEHDISNQKKELNSFMKDGTYNIASTTMTIKGNFRDMVITTTTMEKSVQAYNNNIKMLLKQDPSLTIYNLSDGAYIENTVPLKFKDLKVPTSSNPLTNKMVKSFLSKNSIVGFNTKEKNYLIESVKVIDKFIKEIEIVNKLKVKSYNQFTDIRTNSLMIINNDLKKWDKLYIDRILLTYFLTMEPYLGFQFNEKLDNETYYVKKVKKVWCKQIKKLATDYKELIYSALKV
jgi:hypothetical protein